MRKNVKFLFWAEVRKMRTSFFVFFLSGSHAEPGRRI